MFRQGRGFLSVFNIDTFCSLLSYFGEMILVHNVPGFNELLGLLRISFVTFPCIHIYMYGKLMTQTLVISPLR